MKYLREPGDYKTWNMQQHKSTGTSGEDWIWEGIEMTTETQMLFPCDDYTKIGEDWLNDGTYKEFYHGTCNGYKFSFYSCHCADFVTVGDNYPGSTGLHIHLLCFHGHQTMEFMQTNRNTHGVTLAEIDAKCVPQSNDDKEETPKEYVEAIRSGYTNYNGTYKFDVKHYEELKDLYQSIDIKDLAGDNWKATTTWTSVKKVGGSTSKTVKGYSFNWCSSDNGASFFDIEYYGDKEDDLCFNIENLEKHSNGNYELLKEQHDYAPHTQFKEIKTTFYK